jgi:hypothetical protein
MPAPEDAASVIVAKAQSDQVGRLSNPLNSTPDVGQGCLLILGGKDDFVSGLCEQVSGILKPYFKEIMRSDSLGSLPELTKNVYVLSLIECEDNLFEDMEGSIFQNLQRLLGSATTVLWLLQGSGSNNPYAGVTLGLFRTICYEYSGTLLQTLDIEHELGKVNPTLVAESVLRLRELAEMTPGETDQVLFNFEPELVLKDGQFHVARVSQHEGQNARYNSSKRSITSLVDISKSTPLRLDWAKDSYILREQYELKSLDSDGRVTIRVSCSFLSSVKTPAGFVL